LIEENEWIDLDKKNHFILIINSSDEGYCLNKQNFFVPETNKIFVECVKNKDERLIQDDTLKNDELLNLKSITKKNYLISNVQLQKILKENYNYYELLIYEDKFVNAINKEILKSVISKYECMASVGYYKGHGYNPINNFLRGIEIKEEEKKIHNDIYNIDNYFKYYSNKKVTRDNFIVYRGQKGGKGTKEMLKKLISGQPYQYFNYLSTALHPDATSFFSSWDCCFFQIFVDKNIPFIEFHATTAAEFEILFPRNLVLSLIEIKKSVDFINKLKPKDENGFDNIEYPTILNPYFSHENNTNLLENGFNFLPHQNIYDTIYVCKLSMSEENQFQSPKLSCDGFFLTNINPLPLSLKRKIEEEDVINETNNKKMKLKDGKKKRKSKRYILKKKSLKKN
jgi:hypothetical protein